MSKTKVFEIIEGWKNYAFPTPHTEKVAHARASICATCEKNKNKKCSSCGCILSVKTRSMDSTCPINKW